MPIMQNQEEILCVPEYKQDPGDINVEVILEDTENLVVPNLYYMTISGIEAIANTYPNHVKINGLKNL